jgi:hypothetical protein
MSIEVEEQFVVEANGDTDTMRYELGADELAALHTAIDQDAESQEQDEDETKGDSDQTEADSDDEPGVVASVFSLDYLKQLRTPIPNDGAVTIEIGEDLPATIAFDIADRGRARPVHARPTYQYRHLIHTTEKERSNENCTANSTSITADPDSDSSNP